MKRRGDHHRLEELARLQHLARDERRQELGQSCADTNTKAGQEARMDADTQEASSALDAMFAAPRLCIDRLALAASRFQACEGALAEARQALETAEQAEREARVRLNLADQRLRLVNDMARAQRRKHAAKREDEAIAQAVAAHAWRGDPR